MDKKEMPVAVFDSGMGGISVLREAVNLMPCEDYIYYGDSKHAPYGTKTLEEVRELTISHIDYLVKEGVKAVVIACNTATSAAVRVLREKYKDMPVIGIEPAIKPAVYYKENSTILVMATPMTLSLEKFNRLMKSYEHMADIIPVPCPGLVEFIEEGDLDGEDVKDYLHEIFLPYREKGFDSVVLGCTHYPLIRGIIQKAAGENVKLFDGGEGTAKELKRRLAEKNLLQDADRKGKIVFKNSLEDKVSLSSYLFKM